MHLLLLTQKGADIARYKSKLRQWGISYEDGTVKRFKWQNGTADRQWLTEFSTDLYETRRESIDMVQFFLADWQAKKGIVGQQYGKRYSGYGISSVRIGSKDDEIALHELMHEFKDLVWIYLGVDLGKIMGVADFDLDVVHGRDPRFTEYEYDEVWTVIKPYVQAATRKRKLLATISALERLLILKRKLLLKKREEELEGSLSDMLLAAAVDAIGTDASPSDLAPDELGCAESVSNVVGRVLPQFPTVTGTWTLLDLLSKHSRFETVTGEPEPGDIMLYATGQGVGIFPGHVGIVGESNTVMSNDSATGKFIENYTVASFRDRYVRWGGFKEHIFRIIK